MVGLKAVLSTAYERIPDTILTKPYIIAKRQWIGMDQLMWSET